MRYWIPGRGILGRMVAAVAGQMGQCYATERNGVDIADEYQVNEALRRIQPDVVINCAGVLKGRPLPASEFMRTNGLGPQILAECCDRWKARLVHVSSDCVYSGKRPVGEFYSESDLPDPADLYGRSKLAGEVTRSPHLTVRTSFVGAGDRGLLAWLLAQKEEATGYGHAWRNGLTAPVLAGLLLNLASNDRATGLVHLGGEPISKRGLLELLVKGLNLPLKVVEVPTPLDHRVNRCLQTKRRWAEDLPIPPLQDQIALLAKAMALKVKPLEHPQTADGEAMYG